MEPGPPDMSALLAQAQQVQQALMEAQEALANSEVHGQGGGGLVQVTMKGSGEVTAVAIDPKVIDGAVNGIAGAFRGSGTLLRKTQTGYVRNYVLGITFGTVVILGFRLTRMWWG